MTTSLLEKAFKRSLAAFVFVAMSCTPESRTELSKARVSQAALQLVVASSVTVSRVSYVLSGNGFSRTGSVDVDSSRIGFSFSIPGVPAGKGYQIDLTATASDGSIGTGTAKFDVTARVTTVISVVLRFIVGDPTTGSVQVNGASNVCPLVSSLAAEPLAIAVGASSKLTGVASDLDNLPAPLSYTWKVEPAGVGTLSNATTATPTFTASAPGVATLTLTVSDGDDPCQTLVGSLASLALQIEVTGADLNSAGRAAAGPSKAFATAAVATTLSAPQTSAVSGDQDQPSGYTLVFNDEFSGTSLDRSLWCTRYAYGGGQALQVDAPGCTGPDGFSGTLDFLNSEQQRYVDINHRGETMHVLSGGILSLRATNTGTDSYARYESAMIRSKWEFKPSESERYYITARVRLPNVNGTWPALWLASGFGQSGALVWPPEIDIFEGALNGRDERANMIRIGGQIRGAQTLSGKTEFTYYDIAYSRDTTNFSSSGSLRDTWLVIAAEWAKDSVCYFVNGTKAMCENYRWVDDQGVPANTANLLLNLAIGGEWAGAGGIDDSAFPTSFDIDYVRVYRE